MITIQELLYNRGLDRSARIKLVRHKERGRDLYTIYRCNKGAFFDYQRKQKNDVFRNVDYFVSFVGEESTLARFVGVYKVLGKRFIDNHYIYDIEEVAGYDDLKERIIIKWNNAISWHQWAKNDMEIVEICPGLQYKRFTDYSELILTYSELEDIVRNAYRDWKQVLLAVKGVYLITDLKSGKLYVGSAYGDEGIWGRWTEYVETGGHGGNASLKKMIDNDANYCNNLQFSILSLLPKSVTAEEAISKEQLYKQKLGTKIFGLNNN